MVSRWEDLERSPRARQLAERALLHLIGALKDHDVPIVVLGGLVPEVLTRDQEPPAPQHLGTTDVDIHLGLGLQVEAEQDLGQLEAALMAADFRPDETKEGWRWETRIEGARVKIEFLCELDNQPQEAIVTPVGCQNLTAVNLRGTGFVTEDFEWVELTGKALNGAAVTERVRFAGLQGYLMSRSTSRGDEDSTRITTTSSTRSYTTGLGDRHKRPKHWQEEGSAIASTYLADHGRRFGLVSLPRRTLVLEATQIRRRKPTQRRNTRRLAKMP